MGLFDVDAPNMGPSIRTARKAQNYAQGQSKKGRLDIQKGVKQATPYLQESEQAWEDYGGQLQGGFDMYQNSLGLNGPEGNAAALGAFQNGPGFNYALDQANQNVLRNRAALGGVASGQSMIDLSERARQLQNLEYGNWQDRLAGFDPLRGLAGRSQALTQLSSLFENEGKNLAGNRLAGAGLNNQAAGLLSGVQGQQAMGNAQASNQTNANWMGLINAGLGAAGGFFGA
jgi:hypothetical protein